MSAIQHEFPAREHPFEHVPERLRLAVARLFLLGQPPLARKKKPPTGIKTDRGSSCFTLGYGFAGLNSNPVKRFSHNTSANLPKAVPFRTSDNA
jgi:hypothetical protein